MASPKRRTSVSRKNKRRSHHALPTVTTSKCKNCGATRQPHHYCSDCGFYDGKQIAVGTEE